MIKRGLFLMAVIGLVACGSENEGTSAPPASSDVSTAPATDAADLDPTKVGTISGTISLGSEPEGMTKIEMGSDPNCQKLHTTPVMTEFVVVGEGGGLKNSFVYIKSDLGGLSFPPPDEPVLLDQEGCIYVPHVIGLRAGQPLKIRNSDETLHNVHATPTNNQEFNVGQPIKGLETEKVFDNPEVMVPFSCDVHRWMTSYVGVVDHPFFAVTDGNGQFTMGNVPAGSYTLGLWHEQLGEQEVSVTVQESETAQVEVSF